MNALINLVGQRFGRLVVVKHIRLSLWECVCDCGTVKQVEGTKLKTKQTTSCGCYRRDKHKTHGGTYDKNYTLWQNILSRCGNTANPKYHRYGGRGITLCDRWKKYENFREDMGERPEGRTLDRIDNNVGYCKENCRWATPKEQAHNSRWLKLTDEQVATIREDKRRLVIVAEEYGITPAYVSKIRLGQVRAAARKEVR